MGADGLSVGVADGVGGWADQGVDAGIYARLLMSRAQASAEAATAAQTAALEAAQPEALGGRVILYCALVQSLSHGSAAVPGGDDWNARGTLLGGASLACCGCLHVHACA